jgi:hypothetical protein
MNSTEATITVASNGDERFSGMLHTDPLMAVVVIALAAFGVVAMALYALQRSLKMKGD